MTNDTFHVERLFDGRVKIVCTSPIMVVPPDIAVAMGKALVEYGGGEVIFVDPGTTVIRPGNGNGLIR